VHGSSWHAGRIIRGCTERCSRIRSGLGESYNVTGLWCRSGKAEQSAKSAMGVEPLRWVAPGQREEGILGAMPVPVPNKGLQLTARSVRSCLAPAPGSSSGRLIPPLMKA